MINELIMSPFLWVTLTIGTYLLGISLHKKCPIMLFNPLVFSIGSIILLLILTDIPYENYEVSGKLISVFITPATVALAIKLEKNYIYFKKYYRAMLVGVISGVLIHSLGIFALSFLFKLNAELVTALFPKSITTAIAISVSDSMGGITSLAVAFVVITGIVGAALGPDLLELLKIYDPVAQGVALGSSAHAVGTTKAIELGEIQGAMASISIIVTGIVVVFLAPLAEKTILLFFT